MIEAVRLAESLAALHGGSAPTLRDLRDAAQTLLGHGDLAVIADSLARVDVGTNIGRLADGVSQTPIQDDLNRLLKRYKLEKYRSTVASDLTLDLRENRRVSSSEAAYLDLHRSVLFHRLELLGIHFARNVPSGQSGATWAEHWILQWAPEVEIEIVESTLLGETIEVAAAYVLREKLLECGSITEASALIVTACECAHDHADGGEQPRAAAACGRQPRCRFDCHSGQGAGQDHRLWRHPQGGYGPVHTAAGGAVPPGLPVPAGCQRLQ